MNRVWTYMVSCAGIALLTAIALPTIGHACPENMTLLQAANSAADLVKKGEHRAAISTCYEKFIGSETFDRAAPRTKERFLFEYVDACLMAAERLSPPNARAYLETAITVARRYINWYRDLRSDIKEDWRRLGRERVSSVLFHLTTAYITLRRRGEILDVFEEISSENPQFFSPRSVELWEKTLRSYPDYELERMDSEIRRQLESDQLYRDHCKAFQEFLYEFMKVPRMRRLALRKLVMIEALLGE